VIDFRSHPQAAACTGECQKSGPLGLLVILLLCVACYFLFKSMSKHLKRVRENFPQSTAAGSPAGTSGAKIDLVKRAQVVSRFEADAGSARARAESGGPADAGSEPGAVSPGVGPSDPSVGAPSVGRLGRSGPAASEGEPQ
jgi:hypothetical protein